MSITSPSEASSASKRSSCTGQPARLRADTELLEAKGKYDEALVEAGVMLAGEGLESSSFGKRVELEGSTRNVVDGPFSETQELVAGLWIWQVKSMGEALEWATRCPTPMPGEECVLSAAPSWGGEEEGTASSFGSHVEAPKL